MSGEKFSSLLGPPSNEENAVEFQSVGLAFSSWNRHCELRMITFMVTANFCAGKYEYAENARKLVFGTLCGYEVARRAVMPSRSVLRLTLRRLMSYIYGAPILDVSRSHTTTQHSR